MAKGQKDAQIKVPVPAQLKRKLRIEGAEQGISMAERVRRLVELGREAEEAKDAERQRA